MIYLKIVFLILSINKYVYNYLTSRHNSLYINSKHVEYNDNLPSGPLMNYLC